MSDKTNIGLSSRKVLGWTIAGTIIGFAGGALLIWLFDADLADKAQFGDSMNLLTAFFSALAFAAVAVSLWYQHREVAATLEEMKVSNETQEENLKRQTDIAEAMRLQAEASYRPYLVFRLHVGQGTLISLIVENTGKTAAREVRLSTTYPGSYPGVHESVGNIKDASIFVNGCGVFPPGQQIHYTIAQGSEIHDVDPEFEDHPPTFSITATYFIDNSKEVVEVTTIDMRLFSKSFIVESPELKEFQKIRKSLEQTSTYLKKIAAK